MTKTRVKRKVPGWKLLRRIYVDLLFAGNIFKRVVFNI